MLVSLPFAWMHLFPSSFVDFSKSIFYSLGFSSNFYFHYSGQQYGAESGLLKPFLHIWSLSVEEQYYILFPIILLITFKYFRKYLLTILVISLITSFQMADFGSRRYVSATFYFLHSRMWELLVGSVLSYFEITLGHRSKNKIFNLILPAFGLFLIVHSILFFNDKMYHPSFYTLFPIIGVSLIIWFGNKNELITKILSTKLFVGIGLISYSLYLWHYPVFSFAGIIEFTQGNLFKKLLLAIIILILSIFSYYCIECPARNKSNKFKVIITIIIILTSCLIIFNFMSIKKNGFKNRLPAILDQNLSSGPDWTLLSNSDDKSCYENIEVCKFNTSSNKKIFIIGDSQMESLMFNLKNLVVKNNYQFITSTLGGCMFFPGFNRIDDKTNQIDEKCNDRYFQKLKQTLLKEKNSIIIFGGRFPLYFSGFWFDNLEGGVEGLEWGKKYISQEKYDTIQISFKNELLELSNYNKIILIYPIPEAGWDIKLKLLNSIPKKVSLAKNYLVPKNYITTSYEVYKNRARSSFELLDSIQGDNFYRVYPHKLFCNTTIKDRCLTHDDKNIFYSDINHPSLKGVEMINDLIMKEIKKIELKSN
jgi:peptidoglycan/LPS O-acetylase OafA/YrhL